MSGKSAVGKVRLHGAASERPSFGWAQDVPVSQLARACYYLSILVLTFYDHICILLWKLMVNRWLGDETAAKTPWTQYISVSAAQGSTFPSLLPKAFRDGAGLDALANNLSRLLGGDWWVPRQSQMGEMNTDAWCKTHDELLWLGGGLGPANKLMRYLIPQDDACSGKTRYADTALFWCISLAFVTAGAIAWAETKWPGCAARASIDRSPRGWLVWLVCRLPPIWTMFSFSFLEVTFQMVRDSNHRWSLPAVCIILLALDNPLNPSVFIREQIITVSAWILAAAGYAKIHVTPYHSTDTSMFLTPIWLQGDTLKWHIGSAFYTLEEARSTWSLRAFLHLRQWSIPILAAGTVLIELAGFFLLFRSCVPRQRWQAVAFLYFCTVAWSGMHIGILFTMGIRYQPQMMSYWTLLLPWKVPKMAARPDAIAEAEVESVQRDDPIPDSYKLDNRKKGSMRHRKKKKENITVKEENTPMKDVHGDRDDSNQPKGGLQTAATGCAAPTLAWWDANRSASRIFRGVLRFLLMAGFTWVCAIHRDDFWPVTPVLMYSHTRTAQWQSECLADENLHQFAYEDICITSTPSLYADVHFVYAATANGHTGEMPTKLLARASILQSQQDTFLIDPAGMQSEVIADRKITSPKRLRARALRLALRQLFFTKNGKKRYGKVMWDQFVTEDGEVDPNDVRPNEARSLLHDILQITSGKREYLEEVNKLIPTMNRVPIVHNYSYVQPSGYSQVGKLLGVEFVLNRCTKDGSSWRTLLAALRVDGADGPTLKRECSEARRNPPAAGAPVMVLPEPLALYLGGKFSAAKRMKSWCDELEEPAGAALTFAMNPTITRFCGQDVELIESSKSCQDYCSARGQAASPERVDECTGACMVDAESETACACKRGAVLNAANCKKHTGGTMIPLLCRCMTVDEKAPAV